MDRKYDNNIEIVGKKAAGSSAFYFVGGVICAVLGVGCVVGFVYMASNIGDTAQLLPMFIVGVFILLCGIGLLCWGICIVAMPNDLVAVKGTTIILLKKNIEIKFFDIQSILPRRAHARGISYSFGTIVISLKGGGVHKQYWVANVENVANI
ncbi:MAG: hypothetical protein FWE84_04345, partial [Firmicutes bacterium]|nr:hypothetical protein [Bacillota bacterium]